MCVALDIALAAGGCEAIVEGFYSMVKAHTKSGGQSNNVLVQRAIVDWTIPDPLSCRNTMREIARLYMDGNKSLGLQNTGCQCSLMSVNEQLRGIVLSRL
jgi:hypothetical protein